MNLEELNKAIQEDKRVSYAQIFFAEFMNVILSKFWLILVIITGASSGAQYYLGASIGKSLITSAVDIVLPIAWGVFKCLEYRAFAKFYTNYLHFAKGLYNQEENK